MSRWFSPFMSQGQVESSCILRLRDVTTFFPHFPHLPFSPQIGRLHTFDERSDTSDFPFCILLPEIARLHKSHFGKNCIKREMGRGMDVRDGSPTSMARHYNLYPFFPSWHVCISPIPGKFV